MTRTLTRSLGFTDLVLIVIGTVIGSGIFLVPATVLQQSGGSVGVALLVWLIAGVLSLLGALTYGELGAARPDAGGLYVYLRDAFGPLAGFLYGWTMFLIIASGSCATLAVAFTQYLGQFVTLSPVAGKIVSILMIAVVMVINVRGTRQSANVQNVTTALKVSGLLVMTGLLLAFGHGLSSTHEPWWPTQFNTSILSGVGAAMIGVLWAYEGWQYITFSAGETRDPQRTFPRGLIAGTAALIAIYVTANIGYVAALGGARVATSERVAAEAVGAVFGPAAAKLIAAIILVSMFSATNGLTLTSPRLYYSMARDRVFFAKLAEVHPRFGTPAFAIVVSSLWAMVLAAVGNFSQLLTYVIFVSWMFYALGAAAVFVYRHREPNASRPFRTPGYPVTPILFMVSALAIVINTIVNQPGRAIIGIGVALLGIPVFYLWRATAGRRAPDELDPVAAPAISPTAATKESTSSSVLK
jgi:basic amino acid/polyamine antiporter, APA family